MNEDSTQTFSTFVALGTIIVNTALLIIVLEQICQCALIMISRKVERGLVFVGFVGSALVALIVPWGVIVQRISGMKSYPTLLLQWSELTED